MVLRPPKRSKKAGAGADVLDVRALNRALLARQQLLARQPLAPSEVIERLVGLQAQAPAAPYVGLWTRLRDFRPEALSELLVERRAVRIALMRGTVHLVTARDALTLRPLVQPIFDRDLRVNSTYAAGLAGLDLAALARTARSLVDARPRTMAELRASLHERWPDRDAASLAYGARGLLPLVQVPPRGLWGLGGLPTLTTAEAWLGRPLAPRPSIGGMVRRYLAAFGPEYDNLFVAHADRSRVLADADRGRLMLDGRQIVGTVLVDGFARGTWKVKRTGGRAVLQVAPFRRMTAAEASAVGQEAERLLEFTDAGVGAREVRIGAARRTLTETGCAPSAPPGSSTRT